MKNSQNLDIEKIFEKRIMSELHKVYAEYMLDVETDDEWDRVEKQFTMFKAFIGYMGQTNITKSNS